MADSSDGVNGPGPPIVKNLSESNASNLSKPSMTSAWAETAKKQWSFAEIIDDQRQNRNILELSFVKIPQIDAAGNVTKYRNLTFVEI